MIIGNDYPYDAVADRHHLLIPKQHTNRVTDLSVAAQQELSIILMELEASDRYDCQLTNFPVGQSHPTHFHIHLLRWKRRE